MDAANPLRRWLVGGLATVVVGCNSPDAMPSLDKLPTMKIRGQIPGPVAPTRPPGVGSPAPVSPKPAVIPGGPVTGLPVPASTGDVREAGYAGVAAPKAAELLKASVPQIKVVALVGATNIVTDQEVIEAVRQRYAEIHTLVGHERKAKEEELYSAELRRIIERELILDEMYTKLKKVGKLQVIDEIKGFAEKAANQSIRKIRKHHGNATEEQFHDILRSQGLTLPVIRRQIERQMMADEYIRSVLREQGKTPGLADIRDYYDRNPDEFETDDRVKWLDIFISFNKFATPRAAYDHAEAVRRQAASGVDFVALVKKFDNGLASGNGGVGIGEKRGEIQPVDVEPTVWSLKPGQVSGLIQAPTGYHIVKVVERDYGGVKPFDAEVQADIREKLTVKYRQAEYRRMVEQLWRNGSVQIIEHP